MYIYHSFIHLSSSIRRLTTMSFHLSLSSAVFRLSTLHTFSFPTILAYPESMYLLVSLVSLYLLFVPLESVGAIPRLILSIHVQHISFSASSYHSKSVILYAFCLDLPYL